MDSASREDVYKRQDRQTVLACQNLGVLHSFCNEQEDALACFREAYGLSLIHI